MDEKILSIFRKNSGRHISGEDLSEELGVSRTAVWKHIEELRKIGYNIEAEPHLGYRLIAAPDRLLASEISWGLDIEVVGKKILSFDIVESTMDIAYSLAIKTKDEGVCVFAEAQKKGRGRIGRDWQSPGHKGIYLSVILRPDILPNETSKITLMVAVSVATVMRLKFGLQALIKWPNDVLLKGKKVCGILTEMNAESDKVRFLVVGIGVNVNSSPVELKGAAISIKEALGHRVDRIDFAKSLLSELDRHYAIFNKDGFAAILNEWRNFSATLGRRVKVDYKSRQVEGEALDVDEAGALLVRDDNGFIERIFAGDVTFVR